METVKVFEADQLIRAFKAGRRKGQADISGDSGLFPSEMEVLSSSTCVEIMVEKLVNIKRETVRKKNNRTLTANAIIESVVECWQGVTVDELKNNKTRKREFGFPMQVCFYFLYLHTNHTLLGIGRFFNNRAHDVVLKGARNIMHEITYRPITADLVNRTYELLRYKGYNTENQFRFEDDLLTKKEKNLY